MRQTDPNRLQGRLQDRDFQAYCVIPAAGRSSRMGDWKPLLPWGASSLIETVVDTAIGAGCLPVVVGGYRGSELAALFRSRPEVLVIQNPDWQEGMLGSVRLGAETAMRLAAEHGWAGDGWLVAPADMPGLPPTAFSRLLQRVGELATGGSSHRHTSLFAACGGQAGHPVWIGAELLPAIRGLAAGERLRSYLLSRPYEILETGDRGVLADLDAPEEYRLALEASRP